MSLKPISSTKKRANLKIPGADHFYKDNVSGIIYYIRSIQGKSLKFSCKTQNLSTAKRFANQKLKAYMAGTGSNSVPRLGYWIDLYIEHRGNLEASTSAKRISIKAMTQAKPFWEKLRPDQITREEWAAFCRWHKSKYNIQLESVHKYFRNFLKWLEDSRHNGAQIIGRAPKIVNPDAKKTRLSRKKKKERIFTGDEVTRVLLACDSLRDKLLIMLMFTMAFRVESDALSSRWNQYKMDPELPLYIFGEADNKAGLQGQQAIHGVTFKLLREFKEASEVESEWVFPQMRDPGKHITPQMIDWKGIRSRAGLGWDWTPHTFRHTCLTMLAEAGHPTHLICKCFRISPAEFLNTYAHMTKDGLIKMQNAIEIKL